MAIFDKREEAFENKFFHDEDIRFKAMARRNKRLGQWAAKILGLSGAQADQYADDLVQSDIDGSGHKDILNRVLDDFQAAQVSIGEQTIRHAMERLYYEALSDIRRGT